MVPGSSFASIPPLLCSLRLLLLACFVPVSCKLLRLASRLHLHLLFSLDRAGWARVSRLGVFSRGSSNLRQLQRRHRVSLAATVVSRCDPLSLSLSVSWVGFTVFRVSGEEVEGDGEMRGSGKREKKASTE